MNSELDNLDGVLADVTRRLTEAARNRQSAMHTPVLATGNGAIRVVVLRACDADLAQLRFHTDARSSKVAQIGEGARVNLLAYDPAEKIQIRAEGLARVERNGAVADQAWASAGDFARRCYLAEHGPGTQMAGPTSGLPAAMEGKRPSAADLEPARANFAVILLRLDRLDWLHLAHTGHRRAQFERGDGPWQGRWVVP